MFAYQYNLVINEIQINTDENFKENKSTTSSQKERMIRIQQLINENLSS